MEIENLIRAAKEGRLITPPGKERAGTHTDLPPGVWLSPNDALEAAAKRHTNPVTIIKPPLKNPSIIPGLWNHHASGDVLGYYIIEPCGTAGCGAPPGEACERCGRIEPET